MSDGSSIEWLGWPGYRPATWNPVKGCSRVSSGCTRCYAEVMAARFSKPGQWGHGIAEMRGGDHRWTGRVELDEAKLLLPLRWRSPRCIFVNSTSDLFHEKLPDEAIDRVFAVMALCPQHIFIVLTKRAERMMERLSDGFVAEDVRVALTSLPQTPSRRCQQVVWPLPNVILGVSVEDQATADERIPHLLATPAACRMVSAEPLLGFVRFLEVLGDDWLASGKSGERRGVDCVVAGGESGPGARPSHPDWFRAIRDQCHAACVPFFFKQWGAWVSVSEIAGHGDHHHFDDGATVRRVGKHRAGRQLDGREWTAFPEVGR